MVRLTGSSISAVLIAQLAITPIPSFSSEPNWYAEGIRAESARNYPQAIQNYTLSAKNGLGDAKFALGRVYRDIYGDDVNSFKWFLEAANQGNTFAQYEIGLLYLRGSTAVLPDVMQAGKWLSAAANRGNHGRAAYALFEMSNQDDERLAWLMRAADRGVIEAMQQLGQAYKTGKYGLNIDLAKSKKWLELADQAQE